VLIGPKDVTMAGKPGELLSLLSYSRNVFVKYACGKYRHGIRMRSNLGRDTPVSVEILAEVEERGMPTQPNT
jgi:hypothetical protein